MGATLVSGSFTFSQEALSRSIPVDARHPQISGNADEAISVGRGRLAPARDKTVGRPSPVADLAPSIAAWLAREPGLSGVELFRRARGLGYRGGKTALYDLVRRLRATDVGSPSGPSAAPGVYAALEFVAADVRFATEGRKRVVVLVAQLMWSGFIHATAGFQLDTATTMRCTMDVLAAFGGIPLAMHWVGRRLVVRRGQEEGEPIAWEPALARLALQTGCALQLYEGRDRQRRATRALKTRVLATREFQDRADLDVRLKKWVAEMNRQTDPRHGKSPADLLREEQSRLLPLPGAPRNLRDVSGKAPR